MNICISHNEEFSGLVQTRSAFHGRLVTMELAGQLLCNLVVGLGRLVQEMSGQFFKIFLLWTIIFHVK